MELPKYVMVAGGPTLLIACDKGNPTVPRGVYVPVRGWTGHVRLVGVRGEGEFTIHRDVYDVAVSDYRIYPC